MNVSYVEKEQIFYLLDLCLLQDVQYWSVWLHMSFPNDI